MATYDLFRAKGSASRIGIMKHGRLVATLDTGEPCPSYKRHLVGRAHPRTLRRMADVRELDE